MFSRERLTESTKLITDRLGNDGYAFASVNAVPEVDREKREVAFTLYVDPGRRVYVRRINIGGNTNTQDEVIRREMRQLEGGWYSHGEDQPLQASASTLGYFSEVNIDTPGGARHHRPGRREHEREGAADRQPDLRCRLVERGEDHPVGLASRRQNMFGTGNALSLSAADRPHQPGLALSYTNPYWTDDGVSRGFDMYSRRFNPSALRAASYITNTDGAGRALRCADLGTRHA